MNYIFKGPVPEVHVHSYQRLEPVHTSLAADAILPPYRYDEVHLVSVNSLAEEASEVILPPPPGPAVSTAPPLIPDDSQSAAASLAQREGTSTVTQALPASDCSSVSADLPGSITSPWS